MRPNLCYVDAFLSLFLVQNNPDSSVDMVAWKETLSWTYRKAGKWPQMKHMIMFQPLSFNPVYLLSSLHLALPAPTAIISSSFSCLNSQPSSQHQLTPTPQQPHHSNPSAGLLHSNPSSNSNRHHTALHSNARVNIIPLHSNLYRQKEIDIDKDKSSFQLLLICAQYSNETSIFSCHSLTTQHEVNTSNAFKDFFFLVEIKLVLLSLSRRLLALCRLKQ